MRSDAAQPAIVEHERIAQRIDRGELVQLHQAEGIIRCCQAEFETRGSFMSRSGAPRARLSLETQKRQKPGGQCHGRAALQHTDARWPQDITRTPKRKNATGKVKLTSACMSAKKLPLTAAGISL